MDLMNGFDFSVLLALALLLGALWLASRQLRQAEGWFTTVHEWQHGLLYRHGRFERVLAPGRVFMPPFSGRTVTVLRRTDTVQYVPALTSSAATSSPFGSRRA
jgi:hypothetical protein